MTDPAPRLGLQWDGRLTVGNILTLGAMLLAGLIAFLELRADNIILRGEVSDLQRRLQRIESYVYPGRYPGAYDRSTEPGLGYPTGARASTSSALDESDF